MDDKDIKRYFSYIGGTIIFLIGIFMIIKNVFFLSEVNGYEMIVGCEFITVGVFLFYGKFKGFKIVGNVE